MDVVQVTVSRSRIDHVQLDVEEIRIEYSSYLCLCLLMTNESGSNSSSSLTQICHSHLANVLE